MRALRANVSDSDPALLARIEAAQTTRELFEIGSEIIASRGKGFSTLSNELVAIIIARRNAIIGFDPKRPHA